MQVNTRTRGVKKIGHSHECHCRAAKEPQRVGSIALIAAQHAVSEAARDSVSRDCPLFTDNGYLRIQSSTVEP